MNLLVHVPAIYLFIFQVFSLCCSYLYFYVPSQCIYLNFLGFPKILKSVILFLKITAAKNYLRFWHIIPYIFWWETRKQNIGQKQETIRNSNFFLF